MNEDEDEDEDDESEVLSYSTPNVATKCLGTGGGEKDGLNYTLYHLNHE